MTIITIELPEALSQKLADRGISPDQLNEAATRLILLYVHRQLLSSDEIADAELSPDQIRTPSASGQEGLTLLDLRGSVSVSGPQDFEEIRQQVRVSQAKRIAYD